MGYFDGCAMLDRLVKQCQQEPFCSRFTVEVTSMTYDARDNGYENEMPCKVILKYVNHHHHRLLVEASLWCFECAFIYIDQMHHFVEDHFSKGQDFCLAQKLWAMKDELFSKFIDQSADITDKCESDEQKPKEKPGQTSTTQKRAGEHPTAHQFSCTLTFGMTFDLVQLSGNLYKTKGLIINSSCGQRPNVPLCQIVVLKTENQCEVVGNIEHDHLAPLTENQMKMLTEWQIPTRNLHGELGAIRLC